MAKEMMITDTSNQQSRGY